VKKVLLLVVVFAAAGSVCPAGGKHDRLGVGEKSIAERIAGRSFPSVFQAWARADNLKDEDPLVTTARHDLVWHGIESYGLRWDIEPVGLGEAFRPESIKKAHEKRRALLKLNPNVILIAEIRYRDAWRGFLPPNHEWWLRDERGRIVKGWAEGRFLRLDFTNPQFRRHVARRAGAVVESGVVDGVMLDWWSDDEHRLALVKAVRKAIGDEYLIITNTNDRTAPRTAPYINGYFMECTKSKKPEHWERIAATLRWAQNNLRQPRVNCVETWYHKSRDDLHLMRAVTTLTLTQSNGYCLFSDPNPLPVGDHLHNWYPFWNKTLGRPICEGLDRPDGTIIRQFENGTVIYNPMGNKTVTVTFPEVRTRVSSGESSKSHILNSLDGDIFLREKLNNPPVRVGSIWPPR
jgi:hypothetical protein